MGKIRADLILVIIIWLIKILHYKQVKIIVNAFGLVKIVRDVVM